MRRSSEHAQAPVAITAVSAGGARLIRTENNCLVPMGAECPVTFLRKIGEGSRNSTLVPNPTNRSVFVAPPSPVGKKLG